MRHDQVAVGDDTYETTALPAYTLVRGYRHDPSGDMYPPSSCETLGVSNSIPMKSSAQRRIWAMRRTNTWFCVLAIKVSALPRTQ